MTTLDAACGRQPLDCWVLLAGPPTRTAAPMIEQLCWKLPSARPSRTHGAASPLACLPPPAPVSMPPLAAACGHRACSQRRCVHWQTRCDGLQRGFLPAVPPGPQVLAPSPPRGPPSPRFWQHPRACTGACTKFALLKRTDSWGTQPCPSARTDTCAPMTDRITVLRTAQAAAGVRPCCCSALGLTACAVGLQVVHADEAAPRPPSMQEPAADRVGFVVPSATPPPAAPAAPRGSAGENSVQVCHWARHDPRNRCTPDRCFGELRMGVNQARLYAKASRRGRHAAGPLAVAVKLRVRVCWPEPRS